MSARATHWANRQKTGSPAAKCILQYLGDQADDSGQTPPLALAVIADRAETSRPTARRWLVRLEEMGLVVRFERSGQASEYRLSMGSAALDRAVMRGEKEPETASEPLSDCEGLTEDEGAESPRSPLSNCKGSHPSQNDRGTLYKEDSNPLTPFQKGVRLSDQEIDQRVDAVLAVHPCKTTQRDKLATLVAALPPDEHALLVKACAGYAVECQQHRRKSPMDPARFARKRDIWADFAELAPLPEPEKIFLERGTPEYAGLCVLRAIARGFDDWPPPKAPAGLPQVQGRDGTLVIEGKDLNALAGLARFASEHGRPEIETWLPCEAETKQFYAWSGRSERCGFPRLEPRTTDVPGEFVTSDLPDGTEITAPMRINGCMVPSEWPPRLTDDASSPSEAPAEGDGDASAKSARDDEQPVDGEEDAGEVENSEEAA